MQLLLAAGQLIEQRRQFLPPIHQTGEQLSYPLLEAHAMDKPVLLLLQSQPLLGILQASGLHELGHALGYHHEHVREDTPPSCDESPGGPLPGPVAGTAPH